MEFRIADTFSDSLAKLTSDEQKAVKTTAFDLQMKPASPGMSFHKLDKAKDKNFWSVRVNLDLLNAFQGKGLEEGNPRLVTTGPVFLARPILPRRFHPCFTKIETDQ